MTLAVAVAVFTVIATVSTWVAPSPVSPTPTFAVPAPVAVMSPVGETVATPASVVPKVKPASPVIAVPLASRATTASCWVSFV